MKYLQLHFLTHHGTEAVCALNDVRIFGKSAADDLEDQLALDPAFDASSRPSVRDAATVPGPTLQPLTPQPPADSTLLPSSSSPAANASAGEAHHADSPSQRMPVDPALDNATTGQAGPTPAPHEASTDGTAQPAASMTPAARSQHVPLAPAAPAEAPPAVSPLPQPPGDLPSPPAPPEPIIRIPAPAELQDPTPEPGPPAPTPAEAAQEAAGEGEELLLLPGQGSKAKYGSSVYDVLVAELRALKLQQKVLPRAFAELEHNVSSAVQALGHALGTLALDVSALERCASSGCPSQMAQAPSIFCGLSRVPVILACDS